MLPTRCFDGEILSITAMTANLMLRESPSLASLGQTKARSDGGDLRVDSFFDVFFEVSLNGGVD